MTAKHILHMITPLKHMSPFDINMAADAGYDTIATYANVELKEVTGLVQDAIFSRPPPMGVNTAFFIGGRNAVEALDMLEAGRQALVPPFAISFFADPAGSFTTAAAMVACVDRLARKHGRGTLKDKRVAVFGATGVVGYSSAVLAALDGAKVTLVGYDGVDRVAESARQIKERFGAEAQAADGSSEDKKLAILDDAQIALCAGRAGVQILSAAQIAAAKNLIVAADVNAVPPAGIEGLDVFADGTPLGPNGALGLGPLAIGNIKYQTESGLFKQMIAAKTPVAYDFRDAYAHARVLTA